jgi:hypothetical protein
MHFFSMMTIGMFISHAIGRHPQQGAPVPEFDMRKVRKENGAAFRETIWRSDGDDEISESMFRIIGPLHPTTKSSGRPKKSATRRSAASVPSQSAESASVFLTAEASPAAVPVPQAAAPVKKMRLFFDDTLEA